MAKRRVNRQLTTAEKSEAMKRANQLVEAREPEHRWGYIFTGLGFLLLGLAPFHYVFAIEVAPWTLGMGAASLLFGMLLRRLP